MGARSSAEAEYQTIVVATCELFLIKQFFTELEIEEIDRTELLCDNLAHHLASIPIFHERTKHIDIFCDFVEE